MEQKKETVNLYAFTSESDISIACIDEAFNWASGDFRNESIHIFFSKQTVFDYIEGVFRTQSDLNQSLYSVVFHGNDITLYFSPSQNSANKEKIYVYLQSLFTTPEGTHGISSKNVESLSLDELLYATLCDLSQLSERRRIEFLRQISEKYIITTPYEKLAIRLLNDAKQETFNEFLKDASLFVKLYNNFDSYQEDFISCMLSLYQTYGSSNKGKIVGIGLNPGVISLKSPILYDNLIGLNKKIETIYELSTDNTIRIYTDSYHGYRAAIDLLIDKTNTIATGGLFDVVRFLYDDFYYDIPLFALLYQSDVSHNKVLSNDFVSSLKLPVNMALLATGISEMMSTGRIAITNISAESITRLLLATGDLASLGIGEYCNYQESDFCETYKDYELLINIGLLNANILNQLPDITRRLRLGLTDDRVPNSVKDELKRVVGNADNTMIFKSGESLCVHNGIPLKIKNVRNGTNGKYAIIGRSMQPIETVAKNLEELVGKGNVVILNDKYLNGLKFHLDEYEFFSTKGDLIEFPSKDWSVNDALNDLMNNEKYKAIKQNGFISTIDDIQETPMYKINKQWIEKMKSDGYTIIDIGNPLNNETESLFYSLEKSIMQWNN